VPKLDLLLASHSISQILRSASVGRKLPDVVLVIEHYVFVIGCPTRGSIRRRRAGCVVILSEEFHLEILRHVRHFSFWNREGVPVPAVVEQNVFPQRRPRSAPRMFLHQRPS